MKKFMLICSMSLITTACSSSISYGLLDGSLPVDDKSVSDEILCLTAFTSEVRIPKSTIQKNILREISRRNITPEQCSSYVVSNAGGISDFCSELNEGYVQGSISRMPSFANHITLQDMFAVEKTLGIDCKTKEVVARHNQAIEEQKQRAERERIEDSYSGGSDFFRNWNMFQPKMKMINCTSFGSSTMCNDSGGNYLNINRW